VLPVFVHPPLGAVGLLAGFKTTFPAGSNPLHGIDFGGNEASLGAPRDDELPCPSAASDTMYDYSFASGVMLIHQGHKELDLRIGRHAVVGHVDVVVVELTRHILAIVELTTIHDRSDVLLLVDIKNIGVRPP